MVTIQHFEERIERLEKLNEELIKKVARTNVENFYLAQRVTALEQGYEYVSPALKSSS